MTAWQPNDKVIWTSPARGGYGFARNAAAVVLSASAKRVRIRVAVKATGGAWQPLEKSVKADSLVRRYCDVPEVDGVAS